MPAKIKISSKDKMLSKNDLLKIAKQLNIKGRSSMNKNQLTEAIKKEPSTKNDLLKIAKNLNIKGRSSMNKDQLRQSITSAPKTTTQKPKPKPKKQTFNDIVNKGSVNDIFKAIVKGEGVLNDAQVNNVWGRLNQGEMMNIKLTKKENNQLIDQHIPVNETTRIYIQKLLKKGVEAQEVHVDKSDVLSVFLFPDLVDIEIYKYVPPIKKVVEKPQAKKEKEKPKKNTTKQKTKKLNNKGGGFFPFINTADKIDLSRYQIYTTAQYNNPENNINDRDHCLFHALKLCGVSNAECNLLKLQYCGLANIQKKYLKKIADTLKRDIILHHPTNTNDKKEKQLFKCVDKQHDDINICIFEDHYFTYEDTEYSKYYIDNYDEINKNGGMKKKHVKNKLDSFNLIKMLFNKGYFKKLDMCKFAEASQHKETKNHIYLDCLNIEQRECEGVKIKENKFTRVFYADCESYVNKNIYEYHKLMMLGVVNNDVDDDYVNILHVDDERFNDVKSKFYNENKIQAVVYEFLNIVTCNGKEHALCYFHNLKYDYNLLEPYLNIIEKNEKDGQLYCVTVLHNKKTVELRDSFKLLNFSLSKFAVNLNLPAEYSKKEAVAYEYYTEENHNKLCKIDDYIKMLPNEDIKTFNDNMKTEDSYDKKKKTFNPLEYYKDYLRLDCLCLKKGVNKFNEIILKLTDKTLCVFDCLTISSLTDKFFIIKGCYDGVYEMTGNLREYLSRAVYGGRVCVNPKYEKKIIEGKISDFDGVSLYPSAINRLCREYGLPTGKAKRMKNFNDWDKYNYSVMTVKIKSVNKKQQMPFIAHRGETATEYLNEAPKENIIIDKYTLQDYIEFHKIEYEILDGVYWDDGFNKKMGQNIQELFKVRLKHKKENPALANVIKLMLNSAYGKTITTKTNSKKTIVNTSKRTCDYICDNFKTIKTYREIRDYKYEIEEVCYDDSYNRGHIGCAILSMSKRIMNELFNVANDNNFNIYYTDTDSLHCDFDDIPLLAKKYEEKYNKVLIGKDLEQFHTDFDLKGSVGEIIATKSVFLGKKSYLDVLESKNEKGETIKGHHIRLKGITEAGLYYEANKYKNTYEDLYTDLSKGKEIKFCLNPYDEQNNKSKVLFQFNKGSVKTKNLFYRNVKF